MRVIHTSADFDYAETLCFSDGAVQTLEDLLRDGADIVTDTNMALAGINKKCWLLWLDRRIALWRTRMLRSWQSQKI